MPIRVARPQDLKIVQQLICDSFVEISVDKSIDDWLGPVGGEDWRTRLARRVGRDFALKNCRAFVWEESGEIVGYIGALLNNEPKVGWIRHVAVHPEYQSRGIGRALLSAALDVFRKAGMRMARIETGDNNATAQHLYPKLGFTEVSRQVYYAMKL